MEDAGVPVESLQDTKCGVFIGVMNVDWNRLALWDHHAIQTYTGYIRASRAVSVVVTRSIRTGKHDRRLGKSNIILDELARPQSHSRHTVLLRTECNTPCVWESS
jgi:hypothetical protein